MNHTIASVLAFDSSSPFPCRKRVLQFILSDKRQCANIDRAAREKLYRLHQEEVEESVAFRRRQVIILLLSHLATVLTSFDRPFL